MASRHALFCCALALVACDDAPQSAGRVAASLSSPLEASVQTIGLEVIEACSLTGLERVRCLFEEANSTFEGCAFLELGKSPPRAITTPSERDSACDRVERRERTVYGLPTVTPSTSVELAADPAGERLGVRVDGADEWTIVYLHHGGIEGSIEHTAHALDWNTVPDFRAAVPQLLQAPWSSPASVLAALAEREGDAAMAAVLTTLVSDDSLDLDEWLAKQPEPLKRTLRAELAGRLKKEPNADLLARYLALGGMPDAALLDTWARQLDESGMADLDDLLDLESELRLLIDARHPRAGELSCRVLGGLAVQGVDMLDEMGLEPGLESEPVAQAALAGVALGKTPCPWVAELLRRTPCAPELRCDTTGRLWWEVQDGDGLDEEDEGELALLEEEDLDGAPDRAEVLPLCTPAQARAALARWKDLVDEGTPGPMLLAAALVQGELPAPVVRRNARRTYRAVVPEVKEDEDEDEDRLPPCEWIADSLPAFACHAPPDATVVAAGSCEVRFDDSKRTVTLRVLGAPGASTRPATPR